VRPAVTVSLADLAGTFTGTQSYTFGTNGCAFVHQVFDASYPGSGTVGTVTLHTEGCVSSSITSYTATFTSSTSVGTVSGNADATNLVDNDTNARPDVFIVRIGLTRS
jgi:hypothetical protein